MDASEAQQTTMDSVDSKKQLKVLLFGLGGIGGFYAFILGRNENISLTVVARSTYETIKHNGLKIECQNHGNHQVRIDNSMMLVFDHC